MSYINVIIDAMGSDNAPKPEVLGAMEAIKKHEDLRITLVGNETEIRKYLTNDERIDIVHTDEVVDVNKEPVMEIRKKRNASMVVAFNLVKETENSSFISAGSTGGVVAGGTFITGRIKGVKRPALAPIIPTRDRKGFVLCDVGATPEAKVEYIYQNAIMGSALAKVRGVSNPRIGLLNIGAEDKKGSELYKEAFGRLKESDLNFVGNIEARDVFDGEADVIVCDGFTGNIALKLIEGTSKMLLTIVKEELLSSLISKIGALLAKGSFKNVKKRLDYKETGGALLLGLNNPIIKAHGSSDEKAFLNAILLAYNSVKVDVINDIKASL